MRDLDTNQDHVGVAGVLHELLDDARGALDDLAGGDLVAERSFESRPEYSRPIPLRLRALGGIKVVARAPWHQRQDDERRARRARRRRAERGLVAERGRESINDGGVGLLVLKVEARTTLHVKTCTPRIPRVARSRTTTKSPCASMSCTKNTRAEFLPASERAAKSTTAMPSTSDATPRGKTCSFGRVGRREAAGRGVGERLLVVVAVGAARNLGDVRRRAR